MLGKLGKAVLRRRPPQPVRRRAIDRDDSAQTGDLTTASSYAFRRNRTLTGSLLSEISSPSEHRADLKSPRVQAHTLRYRRRKLVLRLFMLAICIAGLAWILYQSVVSPSVTLVGVDSPSAKTTRRYEKAIQDYLAARPFERLRALIDVKSLVDYLQHDYPEVQSVEPTIAFAGFGRTKFSIVVRHPVVSWQAGATLVFVDPSGAAFYRNIPESPVVQVIDRTGVQATTNKVLVSNRFLEFVGKVVGYFSAQKYTVSSVILPEGTTRQIEVKLEGVGYPVRMSIDRAAAGQVEDAVRAIRYCAEHSVGPAYLDVRVSRRAFYK
jgi:hypothetical protein